MYGCISIYMCVCVCVCTAKSTAKKYGQQMGVITSSYPDCAVGSVDNEGGEREMCKTAFHYEIVCITVIQRASCSLQHVPVSQVGNLRDSGEAQLISGHIWHGLHGSCKNEKWNGSHKNLF